MLNSAAILENFNPMKAFNNRARTVAAIKGAMGRSSESLEVQRIDADLATGALRDVSAATKLALSEVARTRSGKAGAYWRSELVRADSPPRQPGGAQRRRRSSSAHRRCGSSRTCTPKTATTFARHSTFSATSSRSSGTASGSLTFPKVRSWPAGTINTSHFMGGTRMSSSPSDGVVDEYGRVHGMDNLWIAGGSVFPTAGVSMVTYTAVLLALRTAQRIATTTVRFRGSACRSSIARDRSEPTPSGGSGRNPNRATTRLVTPFAKPFVPYEDG